MFIFATINHTYINFIVSLLMKERILLMLVSLFCLLEGGVVRLRKPLPRVLCTRARATNPL